MCYLRSLRQMPGLVGVYFHGSSDGVFLIEGMHVWVSRTIRRHSEKKEGEGARNEPRYLLSFRSTASARCFSACHATFSGLVAGARVHDGGCLASRVAIEEFPRLCCDVYSQKTGSPVFSTSYLSEGSCVFNDNLDISPAMGSR